MVAGAKHSTPIHTPCHTAQSNAAVCLFVQDQLSASKTKHEENKKQKPASD
jgi:hypothetical protein